MNARRYRIAVFVLGLLLPVGAWGSAEELVRRGNGLYAEGRYNDAIAEYDQALVEAPQAVEPKFNKANSYYRLDDLSRATELYKQVAAEARDMELVERSKYNLGNCYFQQGSKQRDSNLEKALEDIKTSIACWRQVLDIDPENHKAARNIEVARLIIKDILDQLNKQKQQQDPNQPRDPNQSPQQQQQKQQQQQRQQQQQAGRSDPNQPQEPNQPDQQRQEQQDRQRVAPDATAQEILDKEKQRRQQRQVMQRGRYQPVKKDW